MEISQDYDLFCLPENLKYVYITTCLSSSVFSLSGFSTLALQSLAAKLTVFFVFFPPKSHFISLISSSCLTACHLGKALSNIKIFFWSVPEKVFTSDMVVLNSHMVAVIFELDLLATNWWLAYQKAMSKTFPWTSHFSVEGCLKMEVEQSLYLTGFNGSC